MIAFFASADLSLPAALLNNKTLITLLGIALALKILFFFIPRKRHSSTRSRSTKRGASRGLSSPQNLLWIFSIFAIITLYSISPRTVYLLAIFVLLATAAAIVFVITCLKRKLAQKETDSEANAISEPTTQDLTSPPSNDIASYNEVASYKGLEGECNINEILQDLGENYRLIYNVMLPADDGTTTQIDHIVVSEFGIFVIETKNYSGWIFGDANGRVWTQTLRAKGRKSEKHAFQNPIRQNYRHIRVLAENLGISKDYFKNIVVFAGNATFKTNIPYGVIYSSQLRGHIKSFKTPIIQQKQLDEIVSVIKQWDATVTNDERASHANNLALRHHRNAPTSTQGNGASDV